MRPQSAQSGRTCHGHLQHLHLAAIDCCCGLAAACREQPARILGTGADCLGDGVPCPLHARGCCCWQGLAVCSPQAQGGNTTVCLASTGQRQGGCHGGCLHLHGWQKQKEGGSGSPQPYVRRPRMRLVAGDECMVRLFVGAGGSRHTGQKGLLCQPSNPAAVRATHQQAA